MTLEELEQKYLQLPKELKDTRRWICYTVVTDNATGEQRKLPMSPFGGCASTTNPSTWSNFRAACLACSANNYLGLGFILGKSNTDNTCYFGIDLDNHADKITGNKLSNEYFYDLTSEFVNSLNSYSEYSHSGDGVHIICKGTLPTGARRKAGGNVEMYDSGRFFTMTGKIINNVPVQDRTEEIKPLWEKYLNTQTEYEKVAPKGFIHMEGNRMCFDGPTQNIIETSENSLPDDELMERIRSSRNGTDFITLFNGDMSQYNNDHSAADLALCTILAFWCANNKIQMDRIFRKSALIRPKWDQHRGNMTYGELTIDKAIKSSMDVYTPPSKKISLDTIGNKGTIIQEIKGQEFDERGDPIIAVKKVFKKYALTDTGNAERFYDQFGDLFKYDQTGKFFMYWNGKKWVVDDKSYIKKYADKLIEIMLSEAKGMDQEIKDASKIEGNADKIKELIEVQKAMYKNIDRISNKAGKEAMIAELEHLHDIPTTTNEYDTQGFLLNTDSGIVDLETGNILPFDRKLLISKSTNCAVSYETPTTWIKFLHDIFRRNNPEETEEIIDCVQKAIGYCLTDSVEEQCMFILHGDGSNGKSTFIEELCHMLGDYGVTGDTDILIQNKNNSGQSTQFSLAGYKGSRVISVSETDDGSKLAEARIKALTGNAEVRAQEKYGKPFTYIVTYKIWLLTNPKPIIRGTDLGIWRRVFYIPFERKFTGAEKDTSMPAKLRAETPKILGWAIEGYKKYRKEGLKKPRCIESALADYKNEMDVINAFLNSNCQNFANYETKASDLFECYKTWAKDDNEYAMSNTKFGQELIKKGYQKIRRSDGFYYRGLKLLSNHKAVSFTSENFMPEEE